MKRAIVFSSTSGSTEKLAKAIYDTLGEDIYCGKISDEALEADEIYVGSWAQAFSCTPDIKAFVEKLNNKKVFVFMTAGYNHTEEFFAPIIESFKANINDTNEIIGEYICQGKVTAAKQEAIKKMDMAKYEGMKVELDRSQSHPDDSDIANLVAKIKALV